jgi:hypothetical protein
MLIYMQVCYFGSTSALVAGGPVGALWNAHIFYLAQACLAPAHSMMCRWYPWYGPAVPNSSLGDPGTAPRVKRVIPTGAPRLARNCTLNAKSELRLNCLKESKSITPLAQTTLALTLNHYCSRKPLIMMACATLDERNLHCWGLDSFPIQQEVLQLSEC